MDNASKALIMAGAVLIAVALVGIGVYLFRAASSSMESGADTIDKAAIQMGNQIVYKVGRSGDVISKREAQLLAEDAIDGYETRKLQTYLKIGKNGTGENLIDSYNKVSNISQASYTLYVGVDSNNAINELYIISTTSAPASGD